MRFLAVRTPILLLVLACSAPLAGAESASPSWRYRDLQFYTVSRADDDDPARIVATMRIVNRAKIPLAIEVSLAADEAAGFSGGEFSTTLRPSNEAEWTFTLEPPEGLVRRVLEGQVAVGGAVERDLYIAVQGPDPPDFDSRDHANITARAEVVATYAPRTRESIERGARAGAARRPEPAIVLASKGRSKYTILVDGLPAPAEGKSALESWAVDQSLSPTQRNLVEAVEDLQRAVSEQSGAILPVVSSAAPDAAEIKARGPIIHLRIAGRAEPGDGYRLATDAAGHVLVEGGTLDAVRQGVYGLLVDHLDCRWFQPRLLGEEIPQPPDRTVRIPGLNETRRSPWFSVGGISWNNSPHWERRNRALVNRGRMNFGHAWAAYLSPAEFPYDKFPDYWARDRQGKVLKFDRGWSSTNFCTTHPEVLGIVARKVNARFDADPAAVVASLDPNDYAPMCLCERCLALDRQYGIANPDGSEVADRLLHFSREIHNRLDPKHNNKYLGILIYGYQMDLPQGAKPHERHVGLICNFPPRYDHSRPWNDPTSEKNRDFFRLVQGWGAQLAQMGYYDYYGHYYYFGPFGIIHKLREDLPAFHEAGGTFLMIEGEPNFAMQGLNLYVAARLAWDLEADVDLLLEEFFTRYYGPAADPMRRFWLAAERHFALERPGSRTELSVAARPEFWSELEAHLREAERVAAKLAPQQQRFRDRIALHRDGFDYGRWRYELMDYLPRKAPPRDRPAALRHLESRRDWVQQVQAKYGPHDPYWPPLTPAALHVNVDEMIERIRKDGHPN